MEAGAGTEAAFPDADYVAKGGTILPSRAEVFHAADIIVQVLCHGSNDRTGKRRPSPLAPDQVLIGFLRPLGSIETIREIADRGVTSFAVELMPRTTRAQSMDALSSMATIAGYKAVVIGRRQAAADLPDADHGGRHDHAGAGPGDRGRRGRSPGDRHGAPAGRRRLGLRHAAGRQGAGPEPGRPVRRAARRGQGRAGRPRLRPAQDETFYQRQRELLGRVVAESDVVITAAVIPGKKSPVLVTARDGGAGWRPGSVIVDLAAERGGNCELTQAGEIASSSTASRSSAGSTWPAPSPTTPARCTPAT